ncbi:GyrI-like domain-containing protein [Psychrobacillus vulpis]|uniref:GyrI-like domain-containing protein n=1 Tax=Psychrobacillus vulpis TaxID=2325572 RepID=UPI001F104A75|nr:GyrI-like domain-containing protein [Psychrobacillus vulpis]
MEPKIIKKKSFQVIGYTFEANLQEIEAGNLCKKALTRLQETSDKILNKVGDHIYLIQIYPMKEDFNAFKDKFTQIIAFEVSHSTDVPEGAIHHTIPENLYAAYTHKGPEADLHKTYEYLYGKWMNENGYKPIGYDMELWDDRYEPENSTNEIDLFIPIES